MGDERRRVDREGARSLHRIGELQAQAGAEPCRALGDVQINGDNAPGLENGAIPPAWWQRVHFS